MATYKKRGAKKSLTKPDLSVQETDSATAEVFETLDTSASKAEDFVAKYQNIILTVIVVVTIGILGSLGYQSYVVEPASKEAVSELNQALAQFFVLRLIQFLGCRLLPLHLALREVKPVFLLATKRSSDGVNFVHNWNKWAFMGK